MLPERGFEQDGDGDRQMKGDPHAACRRQAVDARLAMRTHLHFSLADICDAVDADVGAQGWRRGPLEDARAVTVVERPGYFIGQPTQRDFTRAAQPLFPMLLADDGEQRACRQMRDLPVAPSMPAPG